ncbi:MAG: hypothetical protein OXC91_15405 [Rhodobacteraceae bacterium]|nr:hypothetical protein [Paracoccaceae bacterium]
MANKSVVLLHTPEGRELVADSCKANNFVFAEFEKLVEAQITSKVNSPQPDARRTELFGRFDDILDRIEIEEA